MNQPTAEAMLRELDRFVGEWAMTAGPPSGPPFAQRFTGTFSADGRTITGRWELQEEGQGWRTDFDLTYARVT